MKNHDEYTIVGMDKTISSVKKENWETAIGLNKVDGLTPSKYLLELKEHSIAGEKSYIQVEQELRAYYLKKDFTNSEVQKEFECDIVSTRIAEILEDESFVFSPIYLKSIHARLFDGVFMGALKDYAGKFRDYNITKEEPALNGKTVTYGNYSNLMEYLKYDFDEEKGRDYSALSLEKQIDSIAKFTSSIWQIHPFGEGNTRTTAVFIEKYLCNMGWNVNNDLFKENAVYFRNALVLSNYSNIPMGIYPSNQYLTTFFVKLLHNPDTMLIQMDVAPMNQKEITPEPEM